MEEKLKKSIMIFNHYFLNLSHPFSMNTLLVFEYYNCNIITTIYS
jgi:hypothetical protein